MTSGEQTCDYVYASDIVEVLIKAASTPAAVEVINLGRGRECQIRKLADERVKLTRSRIKIKVGVVAIVVGAILTTLDEALVEIALEGTSLASSCAIRP